MHINDRFFSMSWVKVLRITMVNSVTARLVRKFSNKSKNRSRFLAKNIALMLTVIRLEYHAKFTRNGREASQTLFRQMKINLLDVIV